MTGRKKTTEEPIDKLARIVKRGFDETATKRDLEALATKQEVRDGFRIVNDQFDLIRADIHDIKVTLGPLVRMVAALDTDVTGLKRRMDRVERKVGLAK